MKTQELAGCVIYDDQGKLLVLHRNTPELVQWELPGGKIEKDEDASDTAKREVNEELLIEVVISKEIGQAVFNHKDKLRNFTWFLADISKGTPEIGEPEKFDALRYISLDELTNRDDISPNLINLLKVIG